MLYVGDPMRHLATVGVMRPVQGLLRDLAPSFSGALEGICRGDGQFRGTFSSRSSCLGVCCQLG
jgi:hypothetical protein